MPGHPRLHERNGTYYFRARVPKDLIAAVGKTEIKHSLKTKNKKLAIQRLRTADAEVEKLFRSCRSQSQLRSSANRSNGVGVPINRQDIRKIADAYFERIEARSAAAWFEEADLTGGGNQQLLEAIRDDLAAIGHRLRANDFTGWQATALRELSRSGIKLEGSDALFQELAVLLAQAELQKTRNAEARALGEIIAPLLRPKLEQSVRPNESDQGPTLSELMDSYQGLPEREGLSSKVHLSYKAIYRLLLEVFGSDREVATIKRADCREFREIVIKLPPNATKRFPGKSVQEVVALAEEAGLPRITPKTVNNYLNYFSALMAFAVQEGLISVNPAQGLLLKDGRHTRQDRLPFSPSELKVIFATNEHGGPVTQRHSDPAKFWVPLMALWMGLRMNEACQLEVTDVERIDGVLCVRVASGRAASGYNKRVKNASSERTVPVHPELIALGFEEMWEAATDSDQTQLFPDLKPNPKTGYYSDRFSKWFSRYLGRACIKSPRKSFHSFRHNFLDACRAANLSPSLQAAIGGWTDMGVTRSQANYGSGYSTDRLYEEISKVNYPEVRIGGS